MNYLPITAALFWKGCISEENEIVAQCNTAEMKKNAAKVVILNNHPYEIPSIIEISATANNSYEKWLSEATS